MTTLPEVRPFAPAPRRFNGHELVGDVLAGAMFRDGIRVADDETTTTDERVAA